MPFDSDGVFRMFLGDLQNHFFIRTALAEKQVFPVTLGTR